MNMYQSFSAFNVHNMALLAAIRSSEDDLPIPSGLGTDEELRAWKDGVAKGCAMRHSFEPGSEPSKL